MAWLIDPRRWADEWWAGLSPFAKDIWEVCLTGDFRTVVPGLCKGVSLSVLYDVVAARIRRTERRCTVAQFEEDLVELQEPYAGKVHFLFDPVARVARVPMAPAYNQADNPNQLTAWYRAWRDVPDCDLKFGHIESLRLGVNFDYVDKHGRRLMSDKWDATFGQPEKAFNNGGQRLKTYVELREKWIPRPETVQGTVPVTVQGTLPFSGSGNRDLRSGIGDQGSGIKTVPVTVPPTVSPPGQEKALFQNSAVFAGSSNGGVGDGPSFEMSGPNGDAGGAGGGTGGPSNGSSGARGPSVAHGGEVSSLVRRRLPPGVE